MLKALYDYGVRRQLALPPGFAGKTMKAYISLSESDDHVSVYLGGDEPVPCPDIGSLANVKDKSNVLAEKRSVVIPEEPGSKSTFFLEALRSAAEEEPLLKVCVRALETPELAAAVRAELDRAKIKPEIGSHFGQRAVYPAIGKTSYMVEVLPKAVFCGGRTPIRPVPDHRRTDGSHDDDHADTGPASRRRARERGCADLL